MNFNKYGQPISRFVPPRDEHGNEMSHEDYRALKQRLVEQGHAPDPEPLRGEPLWRRQPDSDPREVCPVCGEWLVLRTIDGRQACADPSCKAGHGFRTKIDRPQGRVRIECAGVDGVFVDDDLEPRPGVGRGDE